MDVAAQGVGFLDARRVRRTSIYDAFYRGAVDYWLDVGLPATERRTRVFIFVRGRGGADFNERDKLVLELLQPHLVARLEEFTVTTHAAAKLASLERGGADSADSIVLCSSAGRLEFASLSARALLRRYSGVVNGRITEALLARRELVLDDGDSTLHVRNARTHRGHVLLLEQRDRRLDTLTPREREILDRAACGSQNEAIAIEFGITPATVAKHLERVYRQAWRPEPNGGSRDPERQAGTRVSRLRITRPAAEPAARGIPG